MRYVKWIFVVLLLSSLTSFVGIDKSTRGLNVGDKAPSFSLSSALSTQSYPDNIQGKIVLLSFWASYNAESRIKNAALSAALRIKPQHDVTMVSVSFDEYSSVFYETIRKDQIGAICLQENEGNRSKLFKRYQLESGFGNYLLDENGIIIAKNISIEELSNYLN